MSGLHSDERRKGVREVDREGSVDGGCGDLLPNGRGVSIFAGAGGQSDVRTKRSDIAGTVGSRRRSSTNLR